MPVDMAALAADLAAESAVTRALVADLDETGWYTPTPAVRWDTQDIADALGVTREPTARLRHVAHIGVGARAFSYAARGQAMPDVPVRVELTAPDGAVWTWGPADVADQVAGDALDFCLLVTQRRHRDDLALTIEGETAQQWMAIAQAFAGPPGPGRAGREPTRKTP